MTQEQIDAIGAYLQFDRRRHEQQGLGLGLVIASLLAQLEGGALTIESVVDQGTTVCLTFVYEARAECLEEKTRESEAVNKEPESKTFDEVVSGLRGKRSPAIKRKLDAILPDDVERLRYLPQDHQPHSDNPGGYHEKSDQKDATRT